MRFVKEALPSRSTRWRFAWFPIRVGLETRWLEWVHVEEYLHVEQDGTFYVPCKFLN